MAQTLADPEVASKLADQGMDLGGGPQTPAAFAAYVQDEWTKYGKLTSSLGLTKQ
ncbi:hypothetical protein D3C87_2012380 [compost metagenome]